MHYFKGHHGDAECGAHRKIVESLEERLLGKNYDFIATNIRYKRGSLEGEIDVLEDLPLGRDDLREAMHVVDELRSGHLASSSWFGVPLAPARCRRRGI